MNGLDVLRLAVGRLAVNRARSVLTMLGVVIGVAALVALVSIAQGATSGIDASLQNLGGDKVQVADSAGTLTDADFAALTALPFVQSADAQDTTTEPASNGGITASVQVQGVTSDYASVAVPTIAAGSFLPTAASTERTRTVVLSAAAASALDVRSTQIGSPITLAGRSFVLVGILSDATGFTGRSAPSVYIPLQTARTIAAPAATLGTATLLVDDPDHVDAVVTEATDLLLRSHHITDATDADFTVTNQATIVSALTSIATILQLLIAGIASISLLVGGIGIMNIMLVSVRERTREIGIRRAIGARQRTILAQFVVEASVLSVIGGLIGILLGLGAAFAVSLVGGWAFVVQWWVVLLATGFSALIGIAFGVYPARTAARMQPVAALRSE